MVDALMSFRTDPPESREESLTRQFYDWEKRGRGWRVYPYPVELEPSFRPILLLDPGVDASGDDARLPTLLSRLFSRSSDLAAEESEPKRSNEYYRQLMAELDEPVICDNYDEPYKELHISLPRDIRVAMPLARQLLLSLGHCRHPIGFEVIGLRDGIDVQFAASDADFPVLRQQVAAYFPEFSLRGSYDRLSNCWKTNGICETVVDFGLSNEFMLPLSAVRSFEIDPLIAVAGALSEIYEDEIGVVQILFQKTRNDWATEIMDSVRFFDGTPFFSNAPEMIPMAKQKIADQLFSAVIRVAAKSDSYDRSLDILGGVSAAFSQLANPGGNELIPLSNDGYPDECHEGALLRRSTFRSGMILNSAELVSFVHPPSAAVRSEKLVRESGRTKAAPLIATGNSLIVGYNDHAQNVIPVSLSDDQRTRHMHLIGSSGSGKSTLLLSLIKQDLESGHGVCVIDPHGDLIDSAIGNVPDHRVDDVVVFDPSDSDHPVGFNILHAKTAQEKTILASDLVATFRRMSTSWGDVMDSVLANAILAFLESSRGGTLFDLKRFLVEKDFREGFLSTISDETVRYFWKEEFPLIAGKPQSSILIRLDAFLRQRVIRNIVCQRENKIDVRSIMDDRKILLVKLSQGLIGEENAYLLGTMLVSRLYQSALGRQDTRERPHFWLYLDEFQHFITPSMERILSGTRKYNLGLILAHQEFRQMQSRSQEVASSVLSNCYTRICFRLGDADSEKFANGFSFFDAKALQNLGVGEAIARIERADFDFNLKVNPMETDSSVTNDRARVVVAVSRAKYSTTLKDVEAQFPSLYERRPEAGKAFPAESTTCVPKNKSAQPLATKPIAENAENNESFREHRYLQNLVKRIGEDHGYRAEIEEQVFGGIGRIDVTLENDHARIACEIALSNSVVYETLNIQKCLAAGFDRIVVLSTDSKHVSRIKERAGVALNESQLTRVDFLQFENFHLFLDALSIANDAVVEKSPKVKGYGVTTSFADSSPAEAETKRNILHDIFSRAWKRTQKDKGE